MFDYIRESLSYDLYDGITVKFVCVILLSIIIGRLMDALTVWLLNRFIQKSEKRALDSSTKKNNAQGEEATRSKRSLFNSQFGLTLSALRLDLLKCLKKPLHVFWVTVGCSLGLFFVNIPEHYVTLCGYIFTALHLISLWCVIWFILNLTNQIVLPKAKEKAKQSETPIDEVLYPMLITVFKIVLVGFGVLILIESCGGDVSKILATLGLGGAAIALASKDTLANLFGSLVILLDNPFVIGDWVTINGYEGNIHEIRLRTTKVKTFDDTIVTIPNSLLTNTQIDTRGKYKAKMDCSFGVLYSTTPEQIEQIVHDLETYINERAIGEERTFEPKHYIYFSGFGDSSMDITAVIYTHNTSYKEHVKLKHQVLLEIVRIVQRAGSGFAFPTRTLELPRKPIKITLDDGSEIPAPVKLDEAMTIERVVAEIKAENPPEAAENLPEAAKNPGQLADNLVSELKLPIYPALSSESPIAEPLNKAENKEVSAENESAEVVAKSEGEDMVAKSEPEGAENPNAEPDKD